MFGVNLPGPFRVGFGRNGKVYAGMNVGPFSVSGAVTQPHTQADPGVYPISMEEAIAETMRAGFKLKKWGEHWEWAVVQNGWTQVRLYRTPQGITWRQETHPAKLWTLLVVVGLVFALCVALG